MTPPEADLVLEGEVAAPVAPRSINVPDTERPVRLSEVTHAFPGMGERQYLRTGETLTVHIGYHANIASSDVVFTIELNNLDGDILTHTNTAIMGETFSVPAGPGTLQIELADLPMLDGDFTYSVGIESRGGVLYDWRDPAGKFEVMSTGKTTGSIYVAARAAILSDVAGTESDLIPQQAT